MDPTRKIDARLIAGNWISFAVAVGACLPWAFTALSGQHPDPTTTAIMAGVCVLGAAFVLSWVVDAAELDLPPALAVSLLALIAVLPEYAVDATFAWNAATDPKQAPYAIANMTGGNRLLLGLGWSTLVFLSWMRFGKPAIQLPENGRTDLAILLVASIYAFVIVVKGTLSLVDTGVMVSLYMLYLVAAIRTSKDEHDDDELVGPAALLDAFGVLPRRILVLTLLVWAAWMIFLAAEPFAESLVETGLEHGLDEFLLVQWVAPLASESPEFAVAWLLCLRGRMSKGLLLLVSSKVNQWTLLVGTLPVVTSVAAGEPRHLPLDTRQQMEILLTAAQSLFGIAVLSDMKLNRTQAMMLAMLFIGQVLATEARTGFSATYMIGAVGVMILLPGARQELARSLRIAVINIRGGPKA